MPDKVPISTVIGAGILWSTTAEGQDFWSQVDSATSDIVGRDFKFTLMSCTDDTYGANKFRAHLAACLRSVHPPPGSFLDSLIYYLDAVSTGRIGPIRDYER